MKKFLGIMLIAGSLIACDNDATTTDNKQDSIDSAAKAQMEMVDSTADQKMDAIDSTRDQMKDSLDKMDSTKK